MLLRNKRSLLAAGLKRSGVLWSLERFAARPGVLVLAYHRIGDPACDRFYSPLISATPEAFRVEMELIARNYRVLALDDLIAAIDDRDQLHVDRPSVLITFDDGYRDNIDLAAPILGRLGLPATLFATTGFLDHSLVPWWDRVAYALKATRLTRIELARPKRMTLDLRHGPDGAITALVARFIAAGWQAEEADLDHLAERTEVDLTPVTLAPDLFLRLDELPALKAAGFAIAAHTRTHRRLAGLDEANQRSELASRVDGSQPALAYPFGGADAFDERTRRLVREADYRLAFALRPSVIRPGPIDRFNLPRFAINWADPPTLLRARLALAAARLGKL